MAETDSDLMNCFGLGLIDIKAREKVLDAISDNPNLTYTECLARAQSKIAVNSVLGGSTSRGGGSINSMQPTDNGGRQCFVCKQTGHLKKECPYYFAMNYAMKSNSDLRGQGRIEKPGNFRGYGGNFRGNYRGRGNGYRGRGAFKNSGFNPRGRGNRRSGFNNYSGTVASMSNEASDSSHVENQGMTSQETHDSAEGQNPFETYDPRVAAMAAAAAAAANSHSSNLN